MISLAFHAIFRVMDVFPWSFANLAKSVRPPFCLFSSCQGVRNALRWIVRGMFCQTRVERMPGELGGIVHGTDSRVGLLALEPWKGTRAVCGPEMTRMTMRCGIALGDHG